MAEHLFWRNKRNCSFISLGDNHSYESAELVTSARLIRMNSNIWLHFLSRKTGLQEEESDDAFPITPGEDVSGGMMIVFDHSKFVHLHVHSEYSPKDGTVTVPELVSKAVNMKMSAIALTDHGVITGLHELFNECAEKNIKAIPGCEIYIEPLIIPSSYS